MQPTVVNVQISTVETLRQMYMPFIGGGGLFIPSTGALPAMGHELFLTLSLPRLTVREATIARVVWVRDHDHPAPQCQCRGYGLQFCGPENRLRAQMENLLAARLNDAAPTCTL
jgi:type IV pilus assembly protein PilZ